MLLYPCDGVVELNHVIEIQVAVPVGVFVKSITIRVRRRIRVRGERDDVVEDE